jgi:hypothetical protein
MNRLSTLILALTLTTGIATAQLATQQLAPKTHTLSAPLSANNRELLDTSMQLLDASYDPQAHLVARPHDGHVGVSRYMVRESSWYAVGLLMRDRTGKHPEDTARAIEILNTVLDNQYVDPKVKWYGTFKYSPEEPTPHPETSAFRGYDPNWRHFIGTTFEIILIEFPNKIPAALQQRLYSSIDAAVTGEMHDGRLVPSYSNIALMYGALWNFAAVHDNNTDWLKQAAAWNDEVFRLFNLHGTFNEFNAPTYYGVDLYGLALWREYGSSAHMREIGSTMEAALWNEIASFYHPALRNMVGPYDRSYGMDMSNYVTPTGTWLRSVMSAPTAPLPEHLTLSTWQVADLWFAPQITLLGTHIPAEAMNRLHHLPAPHLLVRTIDAQRTTTAWLGDSAIWGGEFDSRTKDTGHATQFHPATAQWRMPSGQIGWIKVTRSPNIDAVADRTGITLATDGDITLRIYTAKQPSDLTQAKWTLPGLTADIETDAHGFSAKPAEHAPDCDSCTDLTYTGVKNLRLNFSGEATK